jgi:RNA polymerase sigma-70 factor (ECF subfamily)
VREDKINTVLLHQCVDRMREGDLASRDELLRRAWRQLDRLARKMFRRFPSIRRWVEVDDVLQNAALRLLRALEQERPASTRGFFGLAAEQMRRELIDLARHFLGPHGEGANVISKGDARQEDDSIEETPDRRDDPRDLERWRMFHEAVEHLPAEEREVVGLIFYHDWTQAQVAELFQISVRTVQRQWRSALVRLNRALKEEGTTGASPVS